MQLESSSSPLTILNFSTAVVKLTLLSPKSFRPPLSLSLSAILFPLVFFLSASMSESRGLCNCCVKFLISAGLTVLIFWISFRFIRPRYYIVSFDIPTTNSSSLFASFQLEIENKNRQIGIYHDEIALTLLAGPNLSSPLSHFVVPAFYQGHLKTAEKPGNFSGISDRNRTRLAGESVFRVLANSAFRFKVLGWKSRHHAVSVAGDVEVDADGKKTATKGIRLSSSAAVVAPVGPIAFFLYALVILT